MQHISTVTVGAGGAASITFMAVGDIPSDYTDLVVLFSLRDDQTGEARSFVIELNDVTPTSRNLVGTGSSTASYTQATGYYALLSGGTSTANTFGNGSIYIPNYRSSVAKSASMDMVTETNGTNGFQVITAALFSTTDPVTKIELIRDGGGVFVEHSSASLYGVLAGSDGTTVVS